MVTIPTRYRFSVEEYERMSAAGIFGEDDRIELIEGEIIEMAAVGNRHVACVMQLTAILSGQTAGRAFVSVQNPLRLLPRSMPEPDVVLLRVKQGGYWDSLPGPEDVLLVIEVSDSSLDYDVNTKVDLYARYGVPEVWIWDLQHRQVLMFWHLNEGRYTERFVALPGEILEPTALPGVQVPVTSGMAPEAG